MRLAYKSKNHSQIATMSSAMSTKILACTAGFNEPAPANPQAAPVASREGCLSIEPLDWDTLLDAVIIRLRLTVGEDLHNPPDVPFHSAALSASLTQAIVLDCASALDKLHAALKQERSQRLTH